MSGGELYIIPSVMVERRLISSPRKLRAMTSAITGVFKKDGLYALARKAI